MSRKQFVLRNGATCDNWNWSWSFINRRQRFIIFGLWDNYIEEVGKIFSEDWKINAKGHKSKGYRQSREHIRLIEEEGYRLMTFPMQAREETWQDDVIPKLKSFTPQLSERTLKRVGNVCYAIDTTFAPLLPEELASPEEYPEGAKRTVTINAYERSPAARAACIAHHGCICAICSFDFALFYGELGREYIHVHHLTPIGKIGREYKIKPKEDLIPICPNCHAMIHRSKSPLTVDALRKIVKENKHQSL